MGCSTCPECWTFNKYPDTHAVGAAWMPRIVNVSHSLVSTFNTLGIREYLLTTLLSNGLLIPFSSPQTYWYYISTVRIEHFFVQCSQEIVVSAVADPRFQMRGQPQRCAYYYRPQTKFVKVMFLHLSVSHSVHRGKSTWAGTPRQVHPPGRHTPPGTYTPRQVTPWQCMLGYG